MPEAALPLAAGALVFGIVGAESTGKSTLAAALAERVAQATGLRCLAVGEVLREWCDARGRTPRVDEQATIAGEQAARIEAAARLADVVVCDTTPLMTAVYSRLVFGDRSLDASMIAWQRRCALTLLTALDLPWEPDGLQRDGPHVRGPVDAALRELLMQHRLPFTVVAGLGERRVEAALDAIAPLLRQRPAPQPGLFSRLAERDAAQPDWRWVCEHCDLPECEHAGLRATPAGTSLQRG
ncbi:MAG TPA: ATP-binding protein [Ideonella sp.]|nr:ATP-binding protein [Ideonella sp.]